MNKSTSNRTEPNYTGKADWIIPISVNILLVILVVWIVFSLLHYGIRNKKFQRNKRSNYEKLNSGRIYSLVLLCALTCALRYMISVIVMLDLDLQDDKKVICKALSHLRSCLYSFIHLFIWLFLWLRQYVFYTNRMLALNYPKPIRYFSFITILLIVATGIGYTLFTVFMYNHKVDLVGCMFTLRVELAAGYWAFIGTSVILVHGTLFSLFSYALIKSRNIDKQRKVTDTKKSKKFRKETNHLKTDSTSISTTHNSNEGNTTTFSSSRLPVFRRRQSGEQNQSKKKIKHILKKTFWFAVLSVILENALPTFWSLVEVNQRLVITCYNIIALLNLLLIIFTFARYKDMLFSFC